MLHPSYTELMEKINKEGRDRRRTSYQQPLFHRYCNF